ncbi:carbamoyltransferase HypF [Magnetospirillum molischianum]|uniref:carbamoyltransferase HypF n=1 Tax=Magnetospirillum molischianum TaxID=1083 RepID=UPI0002DF64DE|nr:carbamoyltransferase HypF [Magnetospirillum molischianum]
MTREAIRLRGRVQGVGMRPFVFGLAERLGLVGFVRNDAEGVAIEVEGTAVEAFAAALRAEAPPLARIDALERRPLRSRGGDGFVIAPSGEGGRAATSIPADAATCDACLDDLFDPASRFYLYPFVTCTHCGPRFTITRAVPYDRSNTAMDGFALCPECDRAYRDPRDRRFHAEPIACPVCGPRLSHPVAEIVAALSAGRIVAVKGIGGFHLMCDALNEQSVAELRRRKAREAKPFAVMIANAVSLDRFAVPEAAHRDLIATPARPIVLMPLRPNILAPSVAPNLSRVGFLLPYAPLHHLIFHELAGRPQDRAWRNRALSVALVATSANPGGEPLAVEDDDARRRLAGIADLIVTHDRPILVRADDSVMAVAAAKPVFLRRARGFVPDPIDLGADGPCVLGVGAHLKATVTLTRGREAFVSQHIGDLDTVETVRFYHETVAHLSRVLDVTPDLIACDGHSDYGSTRYAEAFDRPLLRVQHHAAHLAAIAAEHQHRGPLLGVALDGHGRGDDGGNWGGEMMIVAGATWRRIGHLRPLALLGGDRAAREPWRMAVAALYALGRLDAVPALFPEIPLAAALAARVVAAPTTTSLGRLFDAASALLGLRTHQDYEGQAAMELEALVTAPRRLEGGFVLTGDTLDFTPLLAALAAPGIDCRAGAELFHGTLIAGLAAWIAGAASRQEMDCVALGGGCLMNCVLADGLAAALQERGLKPLLARAVPCNDGGLSLGQAAMARAWAAGSDS